MFEKARLKLTLWYLAIIMVISLFFSFAIYTNIAAEFRRFEAIQIRLKNDTAFFLQGSPAHPIFIKHIAPEVIHQARTRLLTTLGVINLVILGAAGGAGYFLAGRTLRPIKEMVDEQNRFITDASHELRTPLTSLRSETEVALRDKNLSFLDAKKLLKSNLEEIINLQMLSEGLLELTQIGKPINSKALTDVSVKDTIDAALKKLNGNLMKKDITVLKKVNDGMIRGIPDRITELFVILLDNAVKYSLEKSTIEVWAKRLNGMIRIEIKDHGIGIPNEYLPHIFERFYRASKSRSKEVSGYGLGLAIAKEIVTSHNGSIKVKSRLNKGTTFTILLPAK